MLQQSRHITFILVCALTVAWWGILHGHAHRPVPTLFVGKSDPSDVGGQVRQSSLGVVGPVRRSSLSAVGQTVPAGSGETGTVPIRISPQINADNTLTQNPLLDSLDLALLRIEIAREEETVDATSFWSRIIPQIHFSASFGMHDMMFIDPTTYTPYILPRDAYRLTINLSLNEALSSPRHTQAILDHQRLRTELSQRTIQKLHARKSLEEQLTALQDQASMLEGEMGFIKELLHFNELRFQQGKIEFDALTRTKLELSAAMRTLLQIHHEEALIRMKLTQ